VASIPSSSTEYLHVPITGATDSMPVELAIIGRTGEPVDADWKSAIWDGADAKILIGPGTSLALTDAVYSVWARVTAPPEKVVLKAGLLRIT
jgi:hypothetical protein